MNTAYAQHGSPPHDMRGPLDNSAQQYRSAQYPPAPVSMAMPPQSHVLQPYGEPYHPSAMSRAPPIPESMHAGELGLAPLGQGTQPTPAEPPSKSCTWSGRHYQLVVMQQPQRARMCGFGDKDRRPITPPPCVKLIVTQADTGKEADFNDIEHGMFVLNVDLWSVDGTKEVNLVRHSANSPSLGTPAVGPGIGLPYQENLPTQYIASQGAAIKFENGQGPAYAQYPSHGPPPINPYMTSQPQQAYSQPPPQYHPAYQHATSVNGAQSYPSQPQPGYSSSQQQQQQMYYTTGAGIHATTPGGAAPGIDYPSQQITPYSSRPLPPDMNQRMPAVNNTPQGMYTRNLIGSLAASAFRLVDPDDKIGIWFVLQDLSVRTEGTFRLRFSFVNVGETSSTGKPAPQSSPEGTLPALNKGKAPVLACCFSEAFTVYSAKRFPGVVESTPLSKCFATQGIKIPIRKDGPGKGDKKDDGYEED